jgi:hypothetical protein
MLAGPACRDCQLPSGVGCGGCGGCGGCNNGCAGTPLAPGTVTSPAPATQPAPAAQPLPTGLPTPRPLSQLPDRTQGDAPAEVIQARIVTLNPGPEPVQGMAPETGNPAEAGGTEMLPVVPGSPAQLAAPQPNEPQ